MKTSATTVGAFEAKNTFSDLLDRVSRRAEITITKHDRPVARLVPARAADVRERKQALARLKAIRGRCSLAGISVRELIETGRR